MMREAVGLGLAAQEYGGSFIATGLVLAGVLEHPKHAERYGAKESVRVVGRCASGAGEFWPSCGGSEEG